MRISLIGLATFLVAALFADVAKAGDCRRAVVVQEVQQVRYQPVQQVVVQRQAVYAQPVQFVQMGYSQQFVQRQSFNGGYGGRQGFRQNLGGGGGGFGGGGLINRQNLGVGIGAAAGAALGGPLGAAGGAIAGSILFGDR